jgi:predicted HicB family RNase H-like nuclease
MNNMLDHNGYKGTMEFSIEDQVFYGQIFGINDTVAYEGSSVKELQKRFQVAVDDYLETCKEMGKEPERAF